MPIVYNIRASANATFLWTRDLTSVAAIYNIAVATVRMQARLSPYAADPPAYQWATGATSGGVVTFDPTTNLVTFAAPESDMAALAAAAQGAPLAYDCRLELSGGECFVLFSGNLCFSPGVTRLTTDATSETGVSGVGDTVSVAGEISTSPVPLPLSLSAALAAAQAAQAAAAASASAAGTSAASITPAALATAMSSLTSSQLQALAAALFAAVPPSAFDAAYRASLAALPASNGSGASAGASYNDNGLYVVQQ